MTPEGAEAAIADRLGGRSRRWLVLDNCEHVLDEARRLAAGLLARCPQLRLVGTSRQRLGVAGERVLRLGPLELGRPGHPLLRPGGPAARGLHTPPGRSKVADVCALVDGLPLGVELAARREAVFGLPRLRDRLERGLAVLDPAAGGDRTTALAATVEWSYRLLRPRRACPLRPAGRVPGRVRGRSARLPHPLREDAAVLLAKVALDASMVVADIDSDPPRYRVLETMRQTGLGHLDPEHRAEARDAHARWMQAHIEAVRGLQDLRSPRRHRCSGANASTWAKRSRGSSSEERGSGRVASPLRWRSSCPTIRT